MKSNVVKKSTIVAILLTSFIYATTAFAQTSVWKVSKGNDYIYLAGTVHILPASELPLPTEFTDAYRNSDAIVLETKLPDPTDSNFQIKMIQKMSYQNGKKLSDVLSKRTYGQLSDYISGFGADINTLNGFKPGFIVTMMAMMEAQRSSISGDGVDAYFNKLAAKDNKEIEYLETADFQLNMLANMGIGDEEKFVKSNLIQMKDFKQIFTELITAWRKGNVKQLEKVVIAPMMKDRKTFKAVITARNQNWIPHIEKMFTDNDREFVLVGVGHLIGSKSVISMLRDKGYTVVKM
jgi:uncharacterized protein YbaP (TraB family)